MGRTAVHTQEQVFEAADKLASNGQEVTPNALRDLLGRGSYSTFVKHIDAWQQVRQAVPVPVILEMPESVKVAFSQCWQAAASEAGKEIAAIREKSDAEIKGTKRRLDEAIAAIEQLEGEAEGDTARLEAAEAALAIERTASQQATTDAAAREAALSATADQMREQIEAQQVELGRVHTEAEVRASKYSSDMQALVSEAENYRGLLMEVEDKLEASLARERVKIDEAASAKAEAARLTDQLKDQKARSVEVIGKLEKNKQALEGELTAIRKETRDMSAQLGRATGELDALRTQVAGQTDVIKGFATSSQGDKKPK